MSRPLPQLSSTAGFYRLALIAGCLLWLLLMVIARSQSLVPIEYLTRDPATIAHHPEYYGALSNLGVLLWNASAVVCLMGALQLKALGSSLVSRRFLIGFGLLSGVLCLDDLFLLHESIIPNKLNLPEEVTFGVYAIALIILLVCFRKILLKTKPLLLLSSLGLFALSIAADKVAPSTILSEQDSYLFEDGLKLLAIFLWLAYFVWTTLTLTTASAASSDPHS